MSAAYLYGRPARPVDKKWSTIVAEAALLGVAIARTDSDRGRRIFVATLGAWTRTFDSLAEVEVFVERLRIHGSGASP
ncbi:MAG: hypothetical protein ABI699_07895 [Caldimonas sp.]